MQLGLEGGANVFNLICLFKKCLLKIITPQPLLPALALMCLEVGALRGTVWVCKAARSPGNRDSSDSSESIKRLDCSDISDSSESIKRLDCSDISDSSSFKLQK